MIEPYWSSTDGMNVIYCGDCLEILKQVGKVDLVVTDPPYGISNKPLVGQERSGKRIGRSNTWHKESWWDNVLNPKWGEEISKATNTIAWFGHWRKRDEVESFISHKLRCEIIWAKNCHTAPPSPVAPRDERIWIFSKFGVVCTRFETSVWDEPVIPTWLHKEHLNEKPVALMSRLVSWISGGLVLDPFMGSGTTGVACVRTGRKFIGIEISKEYCEIAVERIKRELSQPRLALEEKIYVQESIQGLE